MPSVADKYAHDHPPVMVQVSISCPVNPSEDPEKVLSAVMSIFPDATMELGEGAYGGTAPGLDHFSKQIRRQRILDATRAVMISNMRGNRTRLMLNKQVATVGKISFADRNPVLGAIEVTIEDEDLQALIDRVAPITVDGEEVVA